MGNSEPEVKRKGKGIDCPGRLLSIVQCPMAGLFSFSLLATLQDDEEKRSRDIHRVPRFQRPNMRATDNIGRPKIPRVPNKITIRNKLSNLIRTFDIYHVSSPFSLAFFEKECQSAQLATTLS